MALFLGAVASAGVPLSDYVNAASSNVMMQCANNLTLADRPGLASADPSCSWLDYSSILTDAGLDWTDDPATMRSFTVAEDGKAARMTGLSSEQAELTASMSTALTIANSLRLTLGDQAYASRTEAITVDVIGWAFHWMAREEAAGTSSTVETMSWDAELQHSTAFFWGAAIGDALRRMLPLVESVTVRGYGPEAPNVPRTALRADGWLNLELYSGVYESMSEPAPTLTLLENPGLHDDLWPSDGGCVSDKGELRVTSAGELSARLASGSTRGVGLGCLWRSTVEMLVLSRRLIWVTNYQSHEQMLAIDNLRGIGASIVHAHPNGFREESAQAGKGLIDFLEPQGLLGESLRDPYPRNWSTAEAQYATTSAIWRTRVTHGAWESNPHCGRNSHVLAFRGQAARANDGTSADSVYSMYGKLAEGQNTAVEVRKRLVEQALAAADSPSTPKRQARILRKVPWLQPGADVSGSAAASDEEASQDVPTPELSEAVRSGIELAEAGSHSEARYVFEAAADSNPMDADAQLGLGRALSELDDHVGAVEALRTAAELRPHDSEIWISLGVALTPMALTGEAEDEEVVDAFRNAAAAGAHNPKGPLNLARYLMQLSRPEEAIENFYAAAGIDPDYFEEVKLGVGTARGQQGRLREALESFQSASRLNPSNEALQASLVSMEQNAEQVEKASAGVENALSDVDGVCGTPCQEVVDGGGLGMCAVTWAGGCGDIPPPPGFTAESTVADCCRASCAVHWWQQAHG